MRPIIPRPGRNISRFSWDHWRLCPGQSGQKNGSASLNDIWSTQLNKIEFDWAFAEALNELFGPENELNVDYFSWAGYDTWGDFDGGPRDYDSPTDTEIDNPETFPGSWSSNGLPPFNSGETYSLVIDFDYEWLTFSTD